MQLNSGEKSILAYFPDDKKANEAAQKLKESGYHDMQIDGISRYTNRAVRSPSTATLSSMVLGGKEYGSQEYGMAQNPLMAADPSVSGMSARDVQIQGYSYLLTLVTSSDKADNAVQILKTYGAQV